MKKDNQFNGSNLLIIMIGPKRISNAVLNQLEGLKEIFNEVRYARVIWSDDKSKKARQLFIRDDCEISKNIQSLIDAVVVQPNDEDFKRSKIVESIKWKKNEKESNFFVTTSQFIYTLKLAKIATYSYDWTYVLKVRTDTIFLRKDWLREKIKTIPIEGRDKLYVPINPHCHPKKQISDHYLFAGKLAFLKIWPDLDSSFDRVLYALAKYNPERLLKIKCMLNKIEAVPFGERYRDYWNYDERPREYDPKFYQVLAKKRIDRADELIEYVYKNTK